MVIKLLSSFSNNVKEKNIGQYAINSLQVKYVFLDKEETLNLHPPFTKMKPKSKSNIKHYSFKY